MDQISNYLGDFDLCHACLGGEESSIARLQKQFAPTTASYLIGAGAHPSEAIEVVDGLWADLLVPAGDRPPRLARYNGTCALQTWLNRVALNELITRKRKEQRWQKLIPERLDSPVEAGRTNGREPWQAESAVSGFDEAPLLALMKEAVENAFLSCEPEDFVLLQLKHCDGLLGSELGAMFGCDASVISRRLDRAQEHIARMTLLKVRQTDPWLELQWSDFVELCASATPACFGLD